MLTPYSSIAWRRELPDQQQHKKRRKRNDGKVEKNSNFEILNKAPSLFVISKVLFLLKWLSEGLQLSF